MRPSSRPSRGPSRGQDTGVDAVRALIPQAGGRVPEFLWGFAVLGRFPSAPGRLSRPPGCILRSVYLWRCVCRQNPSCIVTRRTAGHGHRRRLPHSGGERLSLVVQTGQLGRFRRRHQKTQRGTLSTSWAEVAANGIFYVFHWCFRAGNRSSGPGFGRI